MIYQMKDLSKVEKMVMTDEDYDKRESRLSLGVNG